MRERFAHMAGITVVGDDLPEESNRVELDATKADADGIPAARVTYALSENSKRLMDHGAADAA